VGNGALTSFWHDLWADRLPLSVKYPALFSHFTGREDAVQEVVEVGVANLMQPPPNWKNRRKCSRLLL